MIEKTLREHIVCLQDKRRIIDVICCNLKTGKEVRISKRAYDLLSMSSLLDRKVFLILSAGETNTGLETFYVFM